MNKTEIINFTRKKEYKYIKYLGNGACETTVLLQDDIINEKFFCKKYSPIYSDFKEILFKNFVNEIKLLYIIHHPNIVRVFNYYLYPENLIGYTIMEYIIGNDIEDYLKKSL